MFCETCGSFIPDGEAVCKFCGTQARQAAQPVAQPAAAQPVARPVQPVAQPSPARTQSYQQPVQPVYQQPVYQQPAYQRATYQQPQLREPTRINGAATVGLIFGILTLVFCWVPFLNFIFAIVGFITSIIGLARQNYGGKGRAIAGLVCTILGSLVVLYETIAIISACSSSSYY